MEHENNQDLNSTMKLGDGERALPWALPLLEGDIVNASDSGGALCTVHTENRQARPVTASAVENIQESAYKEAYDKGIKQGYQEGYDKGFKQSLTKLQKIDVLIHNLFDQIDNNDSKLEVALLNMVRNIAQLVIQRELKMDNHCILQIVTAALDNLPAGSEHIKLHLNSIDLMTLNEMYEADDALSSEYELHEDRNIVPGGCRVESSVSMVDATFESRIEAIFEQIVSQSTSAGAVETDMNEVQSKESVINKSAGELGDDNEPATQASGSDTSPDVSSDSSLDKNTDASTRLENDSDLGNDDGT